MVSKHDQHMCLGIRLADTCQSHAVKRGIMPFRPIIASHKPHGACSDPALMCEQAILDTLAVAAARYTRKNMRILYDALSTLADAQRAKLVPHLPTIMPPLLQRWHLLPDSDRDLLPLLECLTSLAQALGTGTC